MGSYKPDNIDLIPSDLEFAVFSGHEIKKISVVKVVTGLTYDALGHPLPGGLYDPLMGTSGDRIRDPCPTCLCGYRCAGHMGHIELNALVYNPFFTKFVQKIFTVFCLKCFKIQTGDHVTELVKLQLQLIDAGFITEAQELENFKSAIACQSSENIKMENGDVVHPRIAQLYELIERNKTNGTNQNTSVTKISCAARTAVTNSFLQRPTNSKCRHCNGALRSLRYMYRKLVYYVTAAEIYNETRSSDSTGRNKVVLADECRSMLRKIYTNYPELIKLLFPVLRVSERTTSEDSYPTDLFFMDTIAVTPPKARPANILRSHIIEHTQTAIYRQIIENNSVLRVVLKRMKDQMHDLPAEANSVYESCKGATAHEKLYNVWQDLQNSVDLLMDTSYSRTSSAMQGLKQIIEKKDGLIRKHMMGKRVNYAARTVITPDPNINVEEVGIPDIFARKLSYPVPVTPWNISELRKMVLNGPLVHPGANYIEDERGNTTLIPATDKIKRESMAKLLFNFPENGTKIVHRHMINGDVLLLNRQPTLHRPSIMAHKARILQGEKTFRLHYSNCKAYNADFDGDEMNAHYPQNEIARAEAYNLVNVASNYLVPKDGTPLGGLIQDHIISGVKLSIRGRFFNREDYQQLVFQGLSHMSRNIKLLPPTIIKPFQLWSGKQVLSTIIINLIPNKHSLINLHSISRIGVKHWETQSPRMSWGAKFDEFLMSDSRVIIRKGQLLQGVLDKTQYGASTFGLIHCVYELYGGNVSTNLLTAFTKLFTFFLQREGFTLGVKDILVTQEADAQRRKIVKECREAGNAVVASALELDEVPPLDVLAQQMAEAYIKDPKFRVVLDRKYKSILDGFTNEINSTCLQNGLVTKFPENNLQLMVLSGAKGSMVNAMQISCLLGQIELEGKRPPLMISGKSLPSFASFETSPKSGGFIDGRFMTGIQPQEFFFHCMAGREGLIDTAVKTSRSGYLQRCLIKHLEGLTVNYDLTVRDSDSTVIQYLYGEDGLDILKSKFIFDKYGRRFLTHNASAVFEKDEIEAIKDSEIFSKVKRHMKKIRSWKKKEVSDKRHYSAFVHFSAELRNEVEVESPNEINPKTGRRRIDESIIAVWKKADQSNKELYRKKYQRCPYPTASIYSQDRNYGSTSELIEDIIRDHEHRVKRYDRRVAFADVMYLKNMRSLAAPGEPVGLLAAQSIGEPSTQMTLNTFHFAGRGEMNVTLGIPRLREILMLASAKIKTPSMDIPILPCKEKAADKLRIKLNRVTLADILQSVNVKFKLVLDPECKYQYKLRFQFLPREAYKDDFCVKPKNVLKYMSEVFFNILFRTIIRISKNKKKAIIDFDDAGKQGKSKEGDDNEGDLDADDDNVDDILASSSNNSKKGKSIGAEDAANDDESSDGEGGGDDDNDATRIKLKSRKEDEAEYEDSEDWDANEGEEDDEAAEEEHLGDNADDNDNDDDAESHDEMEESPESALLKNEMVTDYLYDEDYHLWCELTFKFDLKHKKPDMASIIRALANKCVIHEVPNIKRAIIYKNDNDEQVLKTDGINIGEICKHNKILNVNRLYCNDIHSIAKTYGIEAATQVIVKEITNVFKVYGITINRRHLSLIADYMTYDGTFQPLSRKGMENSSSPLQQMSFESSMRFLQNAAGSGRIDELNSPSSRLMVGLPVKHGTGSFDLLTCIA